MVSLSVACAAALFTGGLAWQKIVELPTFAAFLFTGSGAILLALVAVFGYGDIKETPPKPQKQTPPPVERTAEPEVPVRIPRPASPASPSSTVVLFSGAPNPGDGCTSAFESARACLRLQWRTPEGQGNVTLYDFPAVIGRDALCNVVINSPSVSRRHARISRAGDAYFLEDLGSSNGSSVDGKPVNGSAKLERNCRIDIGRVEITITGI
jgi:hypothetical protein